MSLSASHDLPLARGSSSAALSSTGASTSSSSNKQDARDAASILMMSLNIWHKGQAEQMHQQYGILNGRKKARSARSKASSWSRSADYAGLGEPSCCAVFLQVSEISHEATSTREFIRRTFELFGNSCVVTAFLSVMLLLPAGMIASGVKHLKDCPIEPKIPVYLLVGGCVGLLKLLSLLWQQFRSRHGDEMYAGDGDGGETVMPSRSSRFSDAIVSVFLVIWFVIGNIWVFRVWPPHFIPPLHEPSNWCDQTAYMMAFVQIVICYVMFGTALLITCFLAIGYSCVACFNYDE